MLLLLDGIEVERGEEGGGEREGERIDGGDGKERRRRPPKKTLIGARFWDFEMLFSLDDTGHTTLCDVTEVMTLGE